MNEQNHPLYSIDRDHLDRLLAKVKPEDADLVELARLIIRYENFPGASDLQEDILKILKLWGISRESLNTQVRKLWEGGFRPGDSTDNAVGSGFDTADE